MHHKPLALVLAVIAGGTLISSATNAQVSGGATTAFNKGRTHVYATVGNGQAFDESYLVLGVGLSYYVVDGLSVGLSAESWSGSDPGIYKITPSVQYVFRDVPLHPYIGGFYRRTFIEDLSDLDSAGARAGVYFAAGRSAYIGAGLVYEIYIDCSESVYRSCDEVYPELSFTFAF
jgi:hypothetical protein